MNQDTAGDIINTVAVEVGLTAVTDVYASTNPLFVQLVTLLRIAGRELVYKFPDPNLRIDYSFDTGAAPTTNVFDLPSDFAYIRSQTGWDEVSNLAVPGGLTDADWSFLTGSGAGNDGWFIAYKENANEIWLYPNPPPANKTIAFTYYSKAWVQLNNQDTRADKPECHDDLVLFDSNLISRYLKYRWYVARRFDATDALMEFEKCMDLRREKRKSAPAISLSRRTDSYLLSDRNVPLTNFGQ